MEVSTEVYKLVFVIVTQFTKVMERCLKASESCLKSPKFKNYRPIPYLWEDTSNCFQVFAENKVRSVVLHSVHLVLFDFVFQLYHV